MKVSLPSALEDFVTSQVKAGEFGDASAVVTEAVRLLREEREKKAIAEMRDAFNGVDVSNGRAEPTIRERNLIDEAVRQHRSNKRAR